MRPYRGIALTCLILGVWSSCLFAQTHFTCTTNTGNNAIVAVLTSTSPKAAGTSLRSGDEIAVFTPAGVCAGAAVWGGINTAITVWGDNDVTPQVDGLRAGDHLLYRVWRKSTNREYTNVSVTYTEGTDAYVPNGIYVLGSLIASTAAVDEPKGGLPLEYSLMQNYPNPFNPTTKIQYGIRDMGFVSLKIYDLQGREVATLVNEKQAAGEYAVVFDGRGLSSGVYEYRLAAGSFSAVRKLVLLR